MCDDIFDDGVSGMELGIMLGISEELAEEERARILEEQDSLPPFPDNLNTDDIIGR